MITSQDDTAPKRRSGSQHTPVRLITSQDDTAPKLNGSSACSWRCLITSQDDTAPKLAVLANLHAARLITSQDDTAPKLTRCQSVITGSLITSQDDTAPKQSLRRYDRWRGLITSQDDTAPKPLKQIPPCKRTEIPTDTCVQLSRKCRSMHLFDSLAKSLASRTGSMRRTSKSRKKMRSYNSAISFSDKNGLTVMNNNGRFSFTS